MVDLPWWFSLSSTLLCLLWSALAFLATRFLVQQVRAGWTRVRDLLGPEGIRTLALLCSAVLFMRAVPRFIEVPLRLIYGVMVSVPLQVMDGAPAAGLSPADDVLAAAPPSSASLGGIARQLVAGLVSQLGDFGRDLPFSELALFLVVWLVMGQALKVSFAPEGATQPAELRALSRILRGIGAHRAMLVLLLISGLGLCVGAITAISELRDTDDPAHAVPSAEELEERLKASQDGFIDETYSYNVTDTDVVTVLHAELLKLQGDLQAAPELRSRSSQISPRLDFVLGARPQLRSSWDNLLKLSQGRYERATQDALTEYAASLGTRHGAREQRQHFLDIVEWHHRARFGLRSVVEKCKQEIVSTETAWALWATDMRFQLAGLAPASPESPQLRQLLLAAQRACQAEALNPVPKRVDFGEALGPLKPIAGWLLQAESVQLALIIGMLGAGLLGSAVATFVSSQGGTKHSSGQLTGVVVRGVTAAIVVFLAIQGGLSTVAVANGAATPSVNPYFVLLICFVAAVYSEQVWDAALRRLKKQLDSDLTGEDSAPATAPANAPAAPAPQEGTPPRAE